MQLPSVCGWLTGKKGRDYPALRAWSRPCEAKRPAPSCGGLGSGWKICYCSRPWDGRSIGSIAVRVLSFRQEPIDHDFWKRKLQIAYDMRCGIGIAVNPTNDTYRLVHGEGDNLPGLVIDIYARTAVMQAHSAGMHVDRMTIAEALSEVMGDKIENIYYKSETTLPFKADRSSRKRKQKKQ